MSDPGAPLIAERRGLGKKLVLSLVPAAGFVWLMHRGALPLVPDSDVLRNVPASAIAVYVVVWIAMYFVRTARWWFLLAPIERVPLWTVVRVACVGFLAVLLLPFRMGEAVRPIMIRREAGVSPWAATGTVGAERVIDGLTISLLLLASLGIARPLDPLPDRIGDLPVPASVVPQAALVAGAVFACGSVVMAVFYWRRAWARRWTERLIGAVSIKLARWLAARVEDVAGGLGFLTRPRFSVPFLLATLTYWLLNVSTFWVLANACGLGEIGFVGASTTMCVVALGIMVPATPGFFGAFQLSIYAGLAMYLAPERVMRAGSAYAFLGYVLPVGMSTLAGVAALAAGLFVRRGARNLPGSAGIG